MYLKPTLLTTTTSSPTLMQVLLWPCVDERTFLPVYLCSCILQHHLYIVVQAFFQKCKSNSHSCKKLSSGSILYFTEIPKSLIMAYIFYYVPCDFISLYLSSHLLDLARTATLLSSNCKIICISGPLQFFLFGTLFAFEWVFSSYHSEFN